MKLSICTDVMADLPFTQLLDKCVRLGVDGIEMTGGGWSGGPQANPLDPGAMGARRLVVRTVGHDGWVRLEMEDFTMSTGAGNQPSIDALQAAISC